MRHPLAAPTSRRAFRCPAPDGATTSPPSLPPRPLPALLLTLATAVVFVVIISASSSFLHRHCLRVVIIIAATPTIAQPAPPCELSRRHLLLRRQAHLCPLSFFVDCCALLLLLLPRAPLVFLVHPSLHADASRPPAPLPLVAPLPRTVLLSCLLFGWLLRRLSSCLVHWGLRLLCCR
jgi:hypothetical protein